MTTLFDGLQSELHAALSVIEQLSQNGTTVVMARDYNAICNAGEANARNMTWWQKRGVKFENLLQAAGLLPPEPDLETAIAASVELIREYVAINSEPPLAIQYVAMAQSRGVRSDAWFKRRGITYGDLLVRAGYKTYHQRRADNIERETAVAVDLLRRMLIRADGNVTAAMYDAEAAAAGLQPARWFRYQSGLSFRELLNRAAALAMPEIIDVETMRAVSLIQRLTTSTSRPTVVQYDHAARQCGARDAAWFRDRGITYPRLVTLAKVDRFGTDKTNVVPRRTEEYISSQLATGDSQPRRRYDPPSLRGTVRRTETLLVPVPGEPNTAWKITREYIGIK